LLNFALKCYPGNLEYVNHCLAQVRLYVHVVGGDDF
jgi:hypothetical protein